MGSASYDSAQPTEQHTLEASFALLEHCLQQLAALAPVADPNQLVDLIPPIPSTAQQLILVELIKFDLAASRQRPELRKVHPSSHDSPSRDRRLESSSAEQAPPDSTPPRSLEFYWPAAARILPAEHIPIDLVLEEAQLRRGAGEEIHWDDYRQRFPDLAETIGKWLASGETNIERQAAAPTASQVPELPIGSVVDDFQILKQLGEGAFARVYLAKQISMQRLVALKASTRGSEEPLALSQLDHPNIVRVHDQRAITQPTAILLYMQYLPGGTLSDCIKLLRELPTNDWNGGKLLQSIDRNLLDANQSVPEQSSIRSEVAEMSWPKTVAWIGIQLAEGLDYASQKSVLHRDVKPANILLSAEAIPKLVDFNVSCSGLSGRAGAAAYFGGSLGYMSPEQLRVADPTDPLTADRLDVRSDLYALGMVLWELWQGRRPWTLIDLASNWTEAVGMQRRLRGEAYALNRPAQNPTERVLEKVLRSLLAIEPDQRPQTGKEIAARLRLALNPELATRFEPAPKSLAGRLLRVSVLLLSALIIFGPNTAASIFNYDYNYRRMAALQSVPNIVNDFIYVSKWVNGVVYPLGLILFLSIMWPIVRIVHRSQRGLPASQSEISRLWNIGNQATLICGVLWAVSGMVFAVSFSSLQSEFGYAEAIHFFLSLVLCGGVAWIYPYFGMTLMAVLIYYPRVIAPTMSDPGFPERCHRVRRHSLWYLLSAAAIPLTAVGALVFRSDLPRNLILAGVCVTGLGLVASFLAHQKLQETLRQFERVLGNRD